MRRTLLALLLALTCSVAAAQESVSFPALNPFQGRTITLDAWLYRPAGPGPFPAIVMLHGCSGMYTPGGTLTAGTHRWAELARTAGYVALLVDSFTPRGERSICAQLKRTILESRERADDAYAALEWLATQPDIDLKRTVLAGWSNGASGTLHAMERPRSPQQFAAAFAFYPGCSVLSRRPEPYQPYAPLLILIGEADDWTPAQPCKVLASRTSSAPRPIELVTYPGAYHSFDRIGSPMRYRPDVRNLNMPGGCCGATVGEHPEARRDAEARTFAFLATALGIKRSGQQ